MASLNLNFVHIKLMGRYKWRTQSEDWTYCTVNLIIVGLFIEKAPLSMLPPHYQISGNFYKVLPCLSVFY